MYTKDPFKKYEVLYRLGMRVETLLPLRIGIGREDRVTEPDSPVIKDTHNRPIIPGSTLKGFFRANSERILRSFLSEDKAKSIIEEVFGDAEDHASCMFFGDLKAVKAELDVRKHIMIDPETGAVSPGRLFEVEFVKEGAIFEGGNLIARNISPCYLGLLHAVKALTDEQLIRIGGFKSRGYGAVKMDFHRISIMLPGVAMDKLYDGVTLIPSVGFGKPVKFRFKASEGAASIEEHDEVVEFSAEAKVDRGYFGARIESVEAEKLLEDLAGVLEKVLRG